MVKVGKNCFHSILVKVVYIIGVILVKKIGNLSVCWFHPGKGWVPKLVRHLGVTASAQKVNEKSMKKKYARGVLYKLLCPSTRYGSSFN